MNFQSNIFPYVFYKHPYCYLRPDFNLTGILDIDFLGHIFSNFVNRDEF